MALSGVGAPVLFMRRGFDAAIVFSFRLSGLWTLLMIGAFAVFRRRARPLLWSAPLALFWPGFFALLFAYWMLIGSRGPYP